MSTFKALQEITYYPAGPTSKTVVAEGELIQLDDKLDHIVGTQINPTHVEKIDPEVIKEAMAAAVAAHNKTVKATKAPKAEK